MKWDEFMPDETPIINIDEFKEQLKQLSRESARFAESYILKMEEFKMTVLTEFQNLLTKKGFLVEMKSLKTIVAKTSKITLTLWEELEGDEKLLLDFLTPDGTFWGFGVYFEPENSNFKKLTEFSGWYVNDIGALATHKEEKCSIEYYKKEVERVEKLVLDKALFFVHVESIHFNIELWQNNKKIGDFNSFEKALDKAVELS